MKGEISHELEQWLGNEDNLEKWENGKLSQMEKRILITHWAGAAWERVSTSEQVRKYFERTGCLLTIDGSEDDRVRIRGTNYTVKPMKDIDPALFQIFEIDGEIEAAPAPQHDDPDQVLVDDDNFDEFDLVSSKETLEDDDELVTLGI